MKTIRGLVVVALVALGLGGCASLSGANAAAQCGNACAATSCPSAFSCYVDARCVARCQPEPARPGLP